MVNPGHRSTGCLQCKQRRVKCDATWPTCLRCAKYGVSCPGYIDEGDRTRFTIIDDTHKTSVRARKAYAKVGKAVDDKATASTSRSPSHDHESIDARSVSKHSTGSEIRVVRHPPAIYPRLSAPSMLQGAVAPLISLWSDPAQDVYWGVFEQAASLYDRGCPHFKASIEALSLLELSLHQASQDYNVRVNAVKRYGQALQLINKSIGGPEQGLDDQTIMAIYLAIIFERRLKTTHAAGSALSHFLAIMKLMQMRGKSILSSLTGRQLLANACIAWHGMVMPLPQPIPCPISSEICQLLTTFTSDKHAPSYQLVPLLNRGILLRKHTLNVLQNKKRPIRSDRENALSIRQILSRIDSLQTRLDAWSGTLSSDWPLPNEISTNLTVNSMRAACIFLHDLNVRCCRLLAVFDHTDVSFEQINMSALQTRQMVDQMCATTPYDFGLDTPSTRAAHVNAVTRSPGEIDYFYHSSFSFPLLIASMVDAGISKVQSHSILAVRKTNTAAMRLDEPIRSYPKVLVQLDGEHEPMQLCEICGTEIHYASQSCPGPNETVAPSETGLRQRLAAFRDRKDETAEGIGEGEEA